MKIEKEKLVLFILRTIQGNLKVVETMSFTEEDVNEGSLTIRKEAFPFNLEYHSFLYGKNLVYMFNLDGGYQYGVYKNKVFPATTLQMYDEICAKHVVKDILDSSKKRLTWKDLILYLIGFVGIGLFFGYLIRGWTG